MEEKRMEEKSMALEVEVESKEATLIFQLKEKYDKQGFLSKISNMKEIVELMDENKEMETGRVIQRRTPFRQTKWTPEMVEKLKLMDRSGVPVKQIAERLSDPKISRVPVTTNAIYAKLEVLKRQKALA